MDNTLQRLLDAEARAEQIARQAEQNSESLIQSALLEARAEESRFESRIPEIHSNFIEKAELRAKQTINELQRRYDERHVKLRELAEDYEDAALEAAFALLIDPRADIERS